jgi:DNA repair exonuclease SbcCD ATPase subunit
MYLDYRGTMSKKETTIDDLARMVAKGFSGMDSRLYTIEKTQKDLKSQMNVLKQGQEDIKLRLDNTAHRFEVEDLKKRVTRLEETVKPA